MLKMPAEYERYISSAKFIAICRQVSPDSLLGVSTGICRRALVDESGRLELRRGSTVDQKMVEVHVTFCMLSPRNSEQ
jgi:hypothetical protein